MAKERTEKAIMDTFLLLLNQNPLDKITVKDIVSACGISRNTFYYHYQDIYDLLRATFAAVVDRVLQENVTTWQESLRSCTSFALENRRAVYHVYRSAYREDLERSLYRVSEERMERLIRHLTAGPNPPAPRSVVSRRWTSFSSGVRMGMMTSCAMRIPSSTVNGSVPWFTSGISSSPR